MLCVEKSSTPSHTAIDCLVGHPKRSYLYVSTLGLQPSFTRTLHG